jgi:hypothetical protein
MADEQYGIRPLEGLRGVAVRMVRRYSAFEGSRLRPDPIRDDQLRSQVEGILWASGIAVFEEAGQDREIAELIITVNTWEAKLLSQCILQVKTEVYEPSELVRDRRLRLAALSWPMGPRVDDAQLTAQVSRSNICLTVANEVERQVGRFVDDYLAANPLHRPGTTGTVRYVVLEGGFYGIRGDNGEHYDPINLPGQYRVNGLRVWFRFRPRTDVVGIRMWGKFIELTEIGMLR